LVSDATRAQETWELSAVSADVHRDEPRVYEASANALLNVVTGISAGVHTALMVGHNPGFEALAYHLAGEGSDPDAFARMSDKYPTCALAVLESAAPFGQWRSASVRLRSFDIARG
jgi:phosphohistidine phosphatase